ncbi:MAG: response regulator transcription factor, partial [Lachnospiraceae bacterium]|nr:response regulator transcription factor [Lachnospiraceae bacterium]
MKVLIAEDDPIIVEGLKIALLQEGYEVEAFGDMKSAIEAIKEEVHFDVCLLDITLPDGDGYQICRTIREKSDVPIIFLTACDDELHTVLAFENEADDYISKPFRIRELLARMKAVMRRSAASVSHSDKAEKNQAEEQKSIEIGRNIL